MWKGKVMYGKAKYIGGLSCWAPDVLGGQESRPTNTKKQQACQQKSIHLQGAKELSR